VIVLRKLLLVVMVGTGSTWVNAGCGDPALEAAPEDETGGADAGAQPDASSDGGQASGADADASISSDASQAELDAGWNAPGDASHIDASADATPASSAEGGPAADTDAAPAPDAAADASAPDGGAVSSPALPSKGGVCPAFVSGDASFSPAGIASRKVRLWVGANGGGPLVIYWHSTGAQPSEAETKGLSGVIGQITAAGGVVAAPFTGANEGAFPWLSTTSESLKVADEIVACAIEKKDVDPRRIHVAGFSAGGLMTSTMSLQRSAYVASVAPYSGGLQGSATFQDASNKLAALVFHGGSSDVFVLNFQSTSTSYSSALRTHGSFTMLCNHGGGHAIPGAGPAAVWRFFQDHPYRTSPSPYVASVPAGIPSYCQGP
jgi:hypothetical protein